MGIKYIHSLNIIHLDLKASNILLFSNGIVKITDFGVSKKIGSVPFDEIIGTKGFIAPEVY